MHIKQWSYWENKEIRSSIDLLIVGAGFTGLSAAISAKRKHPNWRIVVLERDISGEGASTKNAGFACYGTVGEFLDDEKSMGRDAALTLIEKRKKGLEYLQRIVAPKAMDFQKKGGVELFLKGEEQAWEAAQEEISALNQDSGSVNYKRSNHHNKFKSTLGSIYTKDEGQLNPFKLWLALKKEAVLLDIIILHGVKVKSYHNGNANQKVIIDSSHGEWHTQELFIATNAFQLKQDSLDIIPARNQVYVLENPDFQLDSLSYHQNAGYLYFRGLGSKILIGGARHISHREEISREMARNEKIEAYLMQYLKDHFCNTGDWQIHNQWSGIIATGKSKEPIVKALEDKVKVCVRFGGMGVALSAFTAHEAVHRFYP